MKAPLIHLASVIFDQPLAILPEKLETILRVIGPRLIADDHSLDELMRLHYIRTRPMMLDDAIVIDAQSQNGNGEDSKPYRLTPEGVATIPIRGTLMKRFSYLGAASGFSSYAGVMQAATQALEDPQVKAVLFDIDSPGGTTHGCFELSDALFQMRNTDKPIWACANDLAASAAYALASAADRIVLTRTAGVGSVGVFALHADQSNFDEQAGVKFTYIHAGKKKTDGNPHEPLSRSAKADIQAEVDREYEIFVATVARNRGFAGANMTKVASTEAGVFFADNAMPLLADEVGTFDEALQALTSKVNGSRVITSGKLALQPEAGDNAPEPDKVEQPPKEGASMAKLDTDEVKRTAAAAEATAAAAAAKSDPDPDPDKDDDDDDLDKKEAANKGKKADEMKSRRVAEMPQAGNSAAKRIAELCQIAGAPELAAEYLVAGNTVDEVIASLSQRRAKASAEGKVNSFVAGDGGSGANDQMSVDAAIKQAGLMSASSNGTLSQSKCLERLMRSNPAIYNNYLEEKDMVASKVMFSGGGRALNEYVLGNQRRYLANLGLSTAIEAVPDRRPM